MRIKVFAIVVYLMAVSGVASAKITIETVPVGNPGNAGEWSGESYGGQGVDRICGAVDYVYNIGKYEVTAGQYTAFLNAVAKTDTYGLYNTEMWSSIYGCKIQQSGSSGSYTYSVASDYANRPVNFVNWGDAARFANWLHNGQPTGAQNASTTEDGAYYLNGATGEQLLAVTRKADCKWAITSEDEWYKAAYYNPATETYFDYPTSSDTAPGRDTTETTNPGNNANYYSEGHLIGSPYYRTPVGEFELSDSPYGTFDQGGNIWEWNEATKLYGNQRGVRGGSFNYDPSAQGDFGLHASFRGCNPPDVNRNDFGFRVATILVYLTMEIEPNDIGINTVTPAVGENEYPQDTIIPIASQKFILCPDVYYFDHWEGDGIADPNSANTTVMMDTNKTVKAVFVVDDRKCGDECHPNFLPGDFNHDCHVDLLDLQMFMSRWLTCTDPECD